MCLFCQFQILWFFKIIFSRVVCAYSNAFHSCTPIPVLSKFSVAGCKGKHISEGPVRTYCISYHSNLFPQPIQSISNVCQLHVCCTCEHRQCGEILKGLAGVHVWMVHLTHSFIAGSDRESAADEKKLLFWTWFALPWTSVYVSASVLVFVSKLIVISACLDLFWNMFDVPEVFNCTLFAFVTVCKERK